MKALAEQNSCRIFEDYIYIKVQHDGGINYVLLSLSNSNSKATEKLWMSTSHPEPQNTCQLQLSLARDNLTELLT